MIAHFYVDNSVDRVFNFLVKVDRDFEPPLSSRTDLYFYSRKLSDRAVNIFASYNSRDIAHAAFYVNDHVGKIAFLSSICVIKDCRGSGLAARLLEKVSEYCIEQGFETLELEVNLKNKAAVSFYKKNGFAYMDKMPSECCLMRKNLAGIN